MFVWFACIYLLVAGYSPVTCWYTKTRSSSIFNPTNVNELTSLVESNGFRLEWHDVTTPDGYILSLLRLSSQEPIEDGKGPVLLQHGLLDSAATWLLNPRNQSLGYILADHGYDVWLANSRGNTYARRHKNLSPDDPVFWNFTWVEMALYDFPTVVDYVLATTGRRYLNYIGHSQDTRIVFAYLSKNEDYQSKIKSIIALAPPTYLSDIRSPIRAITPVAKYIFKLIAFFNGQEYMPLTKFAKFTGRILCKAEPSFCMKVITLLSGGNSAHTNLSRLWLYLQFIPAGTSIKNMIHYFQGMLSHRFCQFDYGRERNQEAYGQIYPPDFDLARVKVPTYIFDGAKDWLAGPKDVDQTERELGEAVKGRCRDDSYNHSDFLWAYDAWLYIYNQILVLL